MQDEERLERILRPRSICLPAWGPGAEVTEVRVTLPDLRSAPRSQWGDWGPMYSVQVPAAHALQVELRLPGSQASTRHALALQRIVLESPMAARTRACTPLMMTLPLASPKGALTLYFDPLGEAARAEWTPAASSDAALGGDAASEAQEANPCPASLPRVPAGATILPFPSRGPARASRIHPAGASHAAE